MRTGNLESNKDLKANLAPILFGKWIDCKAKLECKQKSNRKRIRYFLSLNKGIRCLNSKKKKEKKNYLIKGIKCLNGKLINPAYTQYSLL